jgi:TusE/DsrC/DsvC family sulfur relay protein
MRLLTKVLAARLGKEKASSLYLYQLFPDGPAKQACRYAGLPKPISCI